MKHQRWNQGGRSRRVAALTLCSALAGIGLASRAGAATSRPSVRSFTALPSALPPSGGTVSLTASVEHASRCVFSSSAAVDGLPQEVGCANGSASAQAAVPANTAPSEKKISFHLEAIDGTRRSGSSRVVVEKPAPPGAGPLVASPSTVPATGGSVTLSDTVSGATRCVFSGGPDLSDLPVSKACSTGAVSATISIPAGTTAGFSRYNFSLTVSGPGGSIHRATSVGQTAPAPPTAGTVDASPSSLPNGGGAVSLSASVSGADSCTYSASPALAGFPVEVACSSGSAAASANIPANSSTSPVSYTFSLVASGAGGTTASPSPATVTEQGAPAPYLGPAPTAGAVSADPDSLPEGGGTVDLATTVSGAETCQYTVTPALSGFPLDESCSSGSATATADIPANSSGSPITYTFSLIASGAGGTTDSASPATVSEAGTPGPAFPLSWSPGSELEAPDVSFAAISCPTASFCAAADDQNGETTTYQAGTWSAPAVTDPGGRLIMVSCASASLCLSSDGSSLFIFDGSAWSVATALPSGFSVGALSCVPGASCMVIDDMGDAYTTSNGTSWSSVAPFAGSATFPEGLSCLSASSCVAIGVSGGENPDPPSVEVWNGTTWTPAGGSWSGSYSPSDFSCSSDTSCMAEAYDESTSSLEVEFYSGSSWTTSPLPGGATVDGGLSCDVGGDCFAFGFTEASGPALYAYSADSWSALAGTAPLSGALSCASSSFCGAVTSNQASTYDGTTWTSTTVGSSAQVSGIACASPAWCMAVDNFGNATTYDGTAWSAPSATGAPGGLLAVSCSSPSFCASLDGAGDVYLYNGSSWSSPAADQDVFTVSGMPEGGISCWSASGCMAVEGGQAAVYDGTSWSVSTIDATNGDLSSVSCPAAGSCVAVDASGAALTYRDGAWSSPTTIDPSASSWPSNSEWISCLSSTLCAAGGYDGYAEFLDGAAWSSPDQLANGSSINGVSCATTGSFCVLGSFDSVYYLEGSGGSYSFSNAQSVVPSSSNPGEGLLRVACGPSSCVGSTFENGGYYGSQSGSGDTGGAGGLAAGARAGRGFSALPDGPRPARPEARGRLTP